MSKERQSPVRTRPETQADLRAAGEHGALDKQTIARIIASLTDARGGPALNTAVLSCMAAVAPCGLCAPHDRLLPDVAARAV